MTYLMAAKRKSYIISLVSMVGQLVTLAVVLTLIFPVAVQGANEFGAELVEAPVKRPHILDVFTNLVDDYKVWGQDTFTKENISMFAGVAASTGVLIGTDFETWQFFKQQYNTSGAFRNWSDTGVKFGDGTFQFAVAGVFLIDGFVLQNARALRTAAQIAEAILATGISTQVIKHVTGRESPFLSTSRTGVWRVFPNQGDYISNVQQYDAMPSGHLATAMTTLVVIEDNYPDMKWIPYVGYPTVGLVAVGLVATSIHWWSDFPIALALGYSFGKTVTRHNFLPAGKDVQSEEKSGPDFFPALSDLGEPMIGARWAW